MRIFQLMCLCTVDIQCLWRSEEYIGSPEIEANRWL